MRGATSEGATRREGPLVPGADVRRPPVGSAQ